MFMIKYSATSIVFELDGSLQYCSGLKIIIVLRSYRID